MSIDTKVIGRLQDLITEGEKINPSNFKPKPGIMYFGAPVDDERANQWGTSCLNILSRVFGKGSDYYIKFDVLFSDIDNWTQIRKGLGILKAAKDDYENGYLFETRVLIEAEVFDDFLERAEQLLGKNYHEPAAVIAGCVLEDGLRKLCQRNGIVLQKNAALDTMNIELAKKGIYSKLVQKNLTSLAHIRNKAAHGEWSEFSKGDVEQMIVQVRAFMEKYFS
jgi:hypothetical protein